MPTTVTDPRPTTAQPGLLGAADVLVVRALELVGKRIVRVERSRYGALRGRPFHEAHTLWQPDTEMLNKALAGAWDQVGQVVRDHAHAEVDAGQVALALDRYVRDLVRARRDHTVADLAYVMRAFD